MSTEPSVMCNGIATSFDKLRMILRQAQDERVVNFHNFEMALREPRSRFTKYER